MLNFNLISWNVLTYNSGKLKNDNFISATCFAVTHKLKLYSIMSLIIIIIIIIIIHCIIIYYITVQLHYYFKNTKTIRKNKIHDYYILLLTSLLIFIDTFF